jgi:hypothetical protein
VEYPVGHELADEQLDIVEDSRRHSRRAFAQDDPPRLGGAIGARVDLVEGTDAGIHDRITADLAAAQMCYPEFSARMPGRIDLQQRGFRNAEWEMT